jgi:DeoR family transcriptional regulator of aga operon
VPRDQPTASAPTELRRARIVETVRSREFVRVADLGEMLGVSSVTVRGDLDVLAARGDLRRIRGGAMLHAATPEAPTSPADELAAIGRAAAALVDDGACVLLAAGAPGLALARALAERAELRDAVIVTNGLDVARALGVAMPRLRVLLTGGTLQADGDTLGDPLGELVLGRLRADVAFLGADAIAPAAGVTDADLAQTAIKGRMLAAAQRRVVLAGAAGVGAARMAQVCALDDVDVLVCGPDADGDAVQALRDGGLEVVVA